MKAKPREQSVSNKHKALIVEDEADIQDVLEFNLKREGFEVLLASAGEQAIKLARQEKPDLILLDLMLPGMDGLEVCRTLKGDPATAGINIVMLTAKGEEADVVVGLELGADDYITKPFSPRVLMARLKAVLRRSGEGESPESPTLVRVGTVAIDPERHEVRVGDEQVQVTRTEFRILHLLAKRPGRVFTRTQIVQNCQGDLAAVTDRSVDVHMVSLRRKLGDAGEALQTVRGVGYRLKDA